MSPDLHLLLDYLEQHRAFDFRAYKLGTLRRRLTRRMDLLDLDGWQSYIEHAQAIEHMIEQIGAQPETVGPSGAG